MPNHTTMNDLAWLRDVVSRMTAAPWLQLSGKYMAVDRGERPQVFRAWNAHDEEGVMVLRNTFDALLEVVDVAIVYAVTPTKTNRKAMWAAVDALHATLAAQRKGLG